MDLYFNARSAILLTVFLQAIVTAFLLFYRSKSKKRTSDFILGVLLLVLGLSPTDFIIGFLGFYDKFTQLAFFPFEHIYLIISLIYLFSLSIIQLEKPDNIGKHLLLPLLYLVLHLAIFLLPYDYKQNFLSKYYFPFIVYIETLLFYIISAYYFVYIFQKLNQHRRLSSSEYSGIQPASLNWLYYFLIGFTIYLSVDFFLTIASELFNFDFEQQYYKYLVRALLTSFLCIAGYNFREHVHISAIKLGEGKVGSKLKKLLTDEDLATGKEIILDYFLEHKPYLNPQLTLKELANSLKMNSNKLSYIINNAHQQNFNDFVNTYRVKELIEKMKNPANKSFTLLALAFESGFNSKTTFNRVFKKLTQKSPKEMWEVLNPSS